MKPYFLFPVLAALLFCATANATDCKKINSLPYTINAPGHYCLEKDLSSAVSGADESAIEITADDVTLDLGGFIITGTAWPLTQADGIRGINTHNVRIGNGAIRGFDDGVNLYFDIGGGGVSQATNHRLENLDVSDCVDYGLRAEGAGVEVRANRVTDIGTDPALTTSFGYGIEVSGDHYLVEGNLVANTNAAGIAALTINSGVIRGNEVLDTFGLSAGPAIGGAVAVYENRIVNSTDNAKDYAIITSVGGEVACKDNVVINFTNLSGNASVPAPPCVGADNLHLP